MLKRIANGFFAGIGFSIAVALAIMLVNFWMNRSDWREEEVIFDPEDVVIVEHRDVRITDYYTVSGLLRFDDRSKYEDVTVSIAVYQDGGYILECSEYVFTEDNSDHFNVQCDLETEKLPEGISYKARVSQATLADE